MPLRSRGVCLDLFAFIVSYLATDTSAALVRPFVSPLHLSVYVPVVSVCSFIRCFSVCCCCACVCLLRCDALRGLWPSFASFVVLIRRSPPRDGRRGCELPTDHRPSSLWPRRRAAPRARVGSAWRLHRALSACPPRPRPSPLFACIAGSCSSSVCARLSLFMCPSPLSRSPVLNPQRSSAVPPCPATRSGVCLVDRKRLRLLATPRACLFCLIVSRPRCALISSAYTYSPLAAVHRSVHRGGGGGGADDIYRCPLYSPAPTPPSSPTFHREVPVPLLSALILTIFHPPPTSFVEHRRPRAHSVSLRRRRGGPGPVRSPRRVGGVHVHLSLVACARRVAQVASLVPLGVSPSPRLPASPPPPLPSRLVSFRSLLRSPRARPEQAPALRCSATCRTPSPLLVDFTAPARPTGGATVDRAPRPPRRPLPLSAAAAPRSAGCRSPVE